MSDFSPPLGGDFEAEYQRKKAADTMARQTAAMGTLDIVARGGNPISETPRFGSVPAHIELERQAYFLPQKHQRQHAEIWNNDASGWKPIREWWGSVMERYKAQNESLLIKKPKNEEEMRLQMEQLKPVVVDPNEVANMRQGLMGIDKMLKAIDPRDSVFTNPNTKHIAEWINREAEPGGAGYLVSGEQKIHEGALIGTGRVLAEAGELLMSPAQHIVHGAHSIARQAIYGLGGPDIGTLLPTNYIEGPDGKRYTNGAKVPSHVDAMVMLWGAATNRNIEQFAADTARTREMAMASEAGLEKIASLTSRTIGALGGFAVPGGAAMQLGARIGAATAQKGLNMLATLRLSRGIEQSERALKIVQIMGRGVGAAAGNGAFEAAAYGSQDGYMKSFLHGAVVTTPLLWTLGWAGRAAERLLSTRAKMPKELAHVLGKGLEGLGFGGAEAHFPDFLPAAWGFLKNPSEETWQTYTKNAAAFMLFSVFSRGKGAAGINVDTPGGQALQATAFHVERSTARRRFAERVARGEATAEELARAPTQDPEALRALGQQSALVRDSSLTPEQRQQANLRVAEIESELDIAEHGVSPTPSEKAVAEARPYEPPPETEPARATPLEEGASFRQRLEHYKANRHLPADQRAKMLRQLIADAPKELAQTIGREGAKIFAEKKANTDAELETRFEMLQAGLELLSARRKDQGVAKKEMESEFEAQRGKKMSVYQEMLRRRIAQDKGKKGAKPTKEELQLSADEIRLSELKRKMEEEKPDDVTSEEWAERTSKLEDELMEVQMREMERKAAGAATSEVEAFETKRKTEEWIREFEAREDARTGERPDLSEIMTEKKPTPEKAPVYEVERRAEAEPTEAEMRAAEPDAMSPENQAAMREAERVQREGLRRELAALRGEPTEVEQRASEARGPGGERSGPGSLQVPPTRQLEATPGVEKVRLSDIELEMQGRPGRKGILVPFTGKRIGAVAPDPVRMTFRHGHISSEQRALGYYKIYGNLVRTKDGLAAVEMAHEWSHGVQVRTLTGQGGQSFLRAAKAETKALPPEIWKESREILKNYPGAGQLPPVARWMETFAEWHARNLLGEVGLDQKFPHLSARFRAWLAHPDQARLRKQYLRIQDMYARYNAQGALGRIEMLAHVEGDPISETAKETKDPISQRVAVAVDQIMFDDAANLKAAQARHLAMSGQDPSKVSIMDDPARLGDALAMVANKQAHFYVKYGFRHPDGTRTPGLEETWSKLQPGRETRDFYSYMISARSLELNKMGKEVNLPPQDFAYAVEQLKARYPHFPEVAKAMKGWSDSLIDTLARTGNWDPAKVERLKNTYTVYVPFFRMLKGERKGPGTPTGADKGTGIGSIKGSTLEIRDPLVALQEVTTRLISASHQNIIKSALYKLAHGHEAEGLATVIPRSKVPKDHEVAKVLDLIEKKLKGPLEEIGHDATDIFEALHDADALDPQIITTFIQRAVPTKGHNIVAFTPRLTEAEIADLVSKGASKEALQLNNEKLIWMELDPAVYDALMGLDKLPHVPAWMQPFMRVLQFPRDVVKFFATGVNPAFTAANWWRDNLVEPILSPSGKFNPLGGFSKSFRGALQRHQNGEMHQLYEEMGGGTASLLNDATRREIARAMPGVRQQFLKTLSWMQEKLAHPENYLREARFTDAYNKAKTEGKPELEARMLALESSKEVMNFIRAGVASRVMNIMTPYWSASLGGRKKVWRQLLNGGDGKTDAEKARIQRASFMNAFASITLPSVVLWAFNRDEEWYQDLPGWRKALFWNLKIGDFILPLPKPFELGVIFGTIPEYILDHQVAGSKPVAVKEILKTTLGNYVEGVGSLIPAIIKPALEVTFDYDFFKMRRLTPEWIERSMPPEKQATFYTTATARLISKALGGALTPIEIEKLIGGYTAGKGVSAMHAIDEIASLRDTPLGMPVPWDRFVALPHSQSAFVDELYQLSVSLEQREDELTGRERGLKHRVDNAKARISALRKQQQSGKLDRAEAERRAYEIARPLVEESNK